MQAVLNQHGLEVMVGSGGGDDESLLAAYPYDDTIDAERSEFTKQCWIPAKPGSRFCIHYAWEKRVNRRAGLFCTLYIDGFVAERAFLPPKGSGKEWEIEGKYYRGPKGPTERPFKFAKTRFDQDADVLDDNPAKGTIRVVLHWAEPDPEMEDPFQDLSKEAADALALDLGAPVVPDSRLMACVALGNPRKSEVEENNMKVQRIDDKEYTFIFHYAHPDWLMSIIPPEVSSTYRTQA